MAQEERFPEPDFRVDGVALEKLRFYAQVAISKHLRNYHGLYKLDAVVKSAVDELVLRLEREIASEELGEVKYPATWWDHFKEAKFPAWAKKRWPVKWAKFEARALYPNVSLPKQDHIIRFFGVPHVHNSEQRRLRFPLSHSLRRVPDAD